MRRPIRLAFGARLTCKLTQALAVGLRIICQQLAQRIVAIGEQTFAPGLDAVQRGRCAVRILALVFERGADRRQLVLASAHLLGQKLRLAFARDLLRNAARRDHLGMQRIRQRQARELRVAEFNQSLGQIKHRKRVATLLAAARRIIIGIGNFIVFAHGPGIFGMCRG